MPVLGPQTYGASKAYFDDVAAVTPEWRAGSRRDGDRVEQAERRRHRRVRRHVGVDAGGGIVEGAVRLRSPDRGRLQPDRAHRRRVGLRLGVEGRSTSCGSLDPAKLATSAIDKAVRSKNAGGDRAGQIHGRARTGGARRSARVPDVLGRCAAGRRGAQLLLEEGRRQPHRRAGARREGEHLLGSGRSAGADDDVRRRAACRSRARPGSRRASGRI